MKRIDTLSEKAKRTYDSTLDIAETLGTAGFSCVCTNLRCEDCPFSKSDNCHAKIKTYEEWLTWANEEIEEDS